MAMEPKVLAPGEVAPKRHLYIITRGTVIFGGRVISVGQMWGDDGKRKLERLTTLPAASLARGL